MEPIWPYEKQAKKAYPTLGSFLLAIANITTNLGCVTLVLQVRVVGFILSQGVVFQGL